LGKRKRNYDFFFFKVVEKVAGVRRLTEGGSGSWAQIVGLELG
jgi:hypothetical protein